MLKIKDNVDLKELEKFGFKPEYDIHTGELNNMYYEIEVNMFVYRVMIIPHEEDIKENDHFPFLFTKINKPKSIVLPAHYSTVEVDDFGALLSEKTIEVIYDLTKAGMIEKIEE